MTVVFFLQGGLSETLFRFEISLIADSDLDTLVETQTEHTNIHVVVMMMHDSGM